MPKYLIERNVPGAGNMSPTELQRLSAASNAVLQDLGPDIQWVHSYVTDDKLMCVYVARDEDLIREHARCGGFPCDRISRVDAMIEPVTGEG